MRRPGLVNGIPVLKLDRLARLAYCRCDTRHFGARKTIDTGNRKLGNAQYSQCGSHRQVAGVAILRRLADEEWEL